MDNCNLEEYIMSLMRLKLRDLKSLKMKFSIGNSIYPQKGRSKRSLLNLINVLTLYNMRAPH